MQYRSPGRMVPLLMAAASVCSIHTAWAAPSARTAVDVVRVTITAERRLEFHLAPGKTHVEWRKLGEKGRVNHGDLVRYTVTARNTGSQPLRGMVITEPIQPSTIYVPHSAAAGPGHSCTISFSTDGGHSFADPAVITTPGGAEKPAPPAAYTDVRWAFTATLDPHGVARMIYEVRVK